MSTNNNIRPLRYPRTPEGKPYHGGKYWMSCDGRFSFFRPFAEPSSWQIGARHEADEDIIARWRLHEQRYVLLRDAVDALEASLTLEGEA